MDQQLQMVANEEVIKVQMIHLLEWQMAIIQIYQVDSTNKQHHHQFHLRLKIRSIEIINKKKRESIYKDHRHFSFDNHCSPFLLSHIFLSFFFDLIKCCLSEHS